MRTSPSFSSPDSAPLFLGFGFRRGGVATEDRSTTAALLPPLLGRRRAVPPLSPVRSMPVRSMDIFFFGEANDLNGEDDVALDRLVRLKAAQNTGMLECSSVDIARGSPKCLIVPRRSGKREDIAQRFPRAEEQKLLGKTPAGKLLVMKLMILNCQTSTSFFSCSARRGTPGKRCGIRR
jgi:hypothetical protein